MSGDLDPDGLPVFPPLPRGQAAQVRARGVAGLVGLRTGVLTVRTETVAAMVVFLDGEPFDGLAVRGGRRVAGPEAVNELGDVPLDHVTVTEVTPELARELGSYFLPSELGSLPANVVVAEDFVRSLARPGRRGCVVVCTADSLGVVFLASGRIALAYGQDGVAGGLEQVASLLADRGATLWARLGPDHREGGPRPQAGPSPVPVPQLAPVPQPEPVPELVPIPQPEPSEPVLVLPDASPEPDEFALPDAFSEPDEFVLRDAPVPAGNLARSPLQVVVEEARAVVGPHAARIESVLSRADPSVEGLHAAAESLRARRLRLFSPATMELIADRAVAALERHAAGRTG